MRKEIKILIGAAATLAVDAAVFFALSGWLEEKYRLYGSTSFLFTGDGETVTITTKKNKVYLNCTRDEAIKDGYSLFSRCCP